MNPWLKGLLFLSIVLTVAHLTYRFKRYFTKYYLVDVTYFGRVYDDDHLFSMMMTGEEIAKALPFSILEARYGGEEMGDYVLRGLDISCEVTKDEFQKFRGKLDSVCSHELRRGYPYMKELEEEDQEEVQKVIKEKQGKYYLVRTHFRPVPKTLRSEYTFQTMLKDEEIKAWEKIAKNHLETDPDNSDEFPNVFVVCEVTKQEYKKFKKYLQGFISIEGMIAHRENSGS